ncbi:daunorubicin resistance protein DrrA family ABC transporter ATP-binding protein [Amycolatopsis benzoatilytica]|uniref:daunorubicin resistance protein DrrA family ABC transporter ATP-binding protein n=1 Tax=Amycolatopsis benzoatilytica TaxID=346045 RepID=UPI00036920F1|nr:daunorubicin resistance protein DrrA family ABC transporter ATP-binding protein [Amycolatopsis benzoatilytica]
MSRDLMIEAAGITRTFGSVTALDEVSLVVERGRVLGLLGHNGAGKTTLVNVLATMLPPTSGSARVAGYDTVREGTEVRRRIGLTGQFASVDVGLTGRANLVLLAKLLGASRQQAARRAEELLAAFALTEAAGRPARTYSGGMRRRLDLAASLVSSPEVLFLDEPTTGLDPTSRINLWQIVEGLVEQGTTVLLTTQYLDEADRLADIITVMSDGRIVASGTAAALKARVGQRSVHVRLPHVAQTDSACAALHGAGLQPAVAEPGVVVTPVATARAIASVIRALDDIGVEAEDIALREPTLDDVYLSLTSRDPEFAA